MDDNSNDRRNFLKLLLTGGVVAGLTPTASANGNGCSEDTVTLLTEDGKLVEISKEALGKFRTGEKANPETIHNFIKPSSKDNS